MFAATIGTTVAVGLVWLYRVLSGRFQLRNLFMLLSTVVAYPLLGYYGLMATGLMALLAWRMGNGLRDQLLSKVVATIVAVVAIIFVPLVCYRYVYCQTPESGIYTTALPIYTFMANTIVIICPSSCSHLCSPSLRLPMVRGANGTP